MSCRLLLATALLAVAAPALARDCDHRTEFKLDLEARDATGFSLKAGSGKLDVRGIEGADSVRVIGTACASHADTLEEMSLVDLSRGGSLSVATEIPKNGGGWFGRHYAYIDLEVEVPVGLALEIEDGSGEIIASRVGPIRIRDGSGAIRVEDARGDVDIHDGSGEIELRTVSGNVTLQDGSGEIDIDGVDGGVLVREDGSGAIGIREVSRDVIIEDDGSGGIDIRNVAGNVRVDADGSGGIEVQDIGGDFEVGRDGSGGIRHSRVEGRVRVPGDDSHLK